MIYKSFSPEDTLAFAAKMALDARAGDIICLCGPLGAGKTAFAKGFALGLDVEGHVSSPSFTIMQLYNSGRLPLYHFDLYRLMEAIDEDALEDIGFFDCLNADGVCLIEWADCARDYIPAGATWLEIELGENFRKIGVAR